MEATRDNYAPFDQDKHLGDPPWDPKDPGLVAWERAHGHDVRLKCYPEFGCLVIEEALERKLDRIRAAAHSWPPPYREAIFRMIDEDEGYIYP